MVPLSTQVYKWVPANLMLGVTLLWTGIQGGVKILLVASCHGNRDKLRPDGPLGSYVDFLLYVKRGYYMPKRGYKFFSVTLDIELNTRR